MSIFIQWWLIERVQILLGESYSRLDDIYGGNRVLGVI
jgi:hypothetical protein